MCGIVGYFGKNKATKVLVEGLEKLEYRGYDSSGVAVFENEKIKVNKCKGRIANLEEKINSNPIEGTIGIGHTRWATHGEPSDVNSHPHVSMNGKVSVVHNGIIENYIHLKEWLQSKGYEFKSQTDTEVIPNLVEYFYEGNLEEAVIKATEKMEGSYAIGVITSNEPEKMVAVKKDNPLIVGRGEGESFIASDVTAILNHTKDIYYIEDMEFVVITNDGIVFMDENKNPITKELTHITWDAAAAEKGGYDHFMIKEINEQPKAVRDTMTSRVMLGEDIKIDNISLSKEDLKGINRLHIVACGTAYYAGAVGKTAIEKLARIPVEIEVASEFRYKDPILDEQSLMIVVSQSGETADTLAALRLAKERGARVIVVTNVMGSTMSREADDVLYTWAGPEIAVASTKAYLTQIIALDIIALYLAQLKGTLTTEELEAYKKEMLTLPEKIETVLKQEEAVKEFSVNNYHHNDMFFLGRGVDYAVALEGALKLKELSYIHAEAYAAGELKHGPIALIEEGTPIIGIATEDNLIDKTVSNLQEVAARGGKILGLTNEGNTEITKSVDSTIYVPKTESIFSPIITVVPLQLLSYHIAVAKGCDVDKPRNLAKSVTVE